MTSAFGDVIEELQATNTARKQFDLALKYSDTFDRILSQRQSYATSEDYDALIVASLQNGSSELMSIFVDQLLNSRNYVDWKKCPEKIVRFLKVISDCKYDEQYERDHQYVLQSLLVISKRLRIQEKMQLFIKDILVKSLQTSELWHPISRASMSVSGEYAWKECTEQDAIMVYHLLLRQLKKRPDPPSKSYFYNSVLLIVVFSLRFMQKFLLESLSTEFANILEFCQQQEFYSNDVTADLGSKTLSHAVCLAIMQNLDWNNFSPDSLSIILPHIEDLTDCEDDELKYAAEYIVRETRHSRCDRHEEELTMVDKYLKGGQDVLICKFSALYKTSPEAFDFKIPVIMDKMHNQDWILTTTMTLLWEVAKMEPQIFTKEMIQQVVNTVQIPNTGPAALMVLAALAKNNPSDVIQHDSKVLEAIEKLPQGGDAGFGVLVPLSSLDEECAARYVQFILGRFDRTTSPQKKADLLNYLRMIGENWPPVLARHEVRLKSIRSQETSVVKEAAQHCIDIIDDNQAQMMDNAGDITMVKQRMDDEIRYTPSRQRDQETTDNQNNTNTDKKEEVKSNTCTCQ